MQLESSKKEKRIAFPPCAAVARRETTPDQNVSASSRLTLDEVHRLFQSVGVSVAVVQDVRPNGDPRDPGRVGVDVIDGVEHCLHGLYPALGHDGTAGVGRVSLVDHVEAAEDDVTLDLGRPLQRPVGIAAVVDVVAGGVRVPLVAAVPEHAVVVSQPRGIEAGAEAGEQSQHCQKCPRRGHYYSTVCMNLSVSCFHCKLSLPFRGEFFKSSSSLILLPKSFRVRVAHNPKKGPSVGLLLLGLRPKGGLPKKKKKKTPNYADLKRKLEER